MFTGLIQEIGKIKNMTKTLKGAKIKIECQKVIENCKIGDSISTNGVCLTVIEYGKGYFIAEAMNESLKITTLKNIKNGEKVNLEKSLTLRSFLGGHVVMGDVDCIGTIKKIEIDGFSKKYKIEIPKKFLKYVVYKGRISVDGASLTVCDTDKTGFIVSLIPHTQQNIILGYKKNGEKVNIETDIFGKYVEKMFIVQETKEEKYKSYDIFGGKLCFQE